MVRRDGGGSDPPTFPYLFPDFQNVRQGHPSVVSRGEIVVIRASRAMEAGAHSFVWCKIILEQYFTLYMF